MKRDNKRYLEYQIVITPDIRTGSRKQCFTAFVPALGIADDGDSIEEALQNIRALTVFHLESLRKEKQPLPEEPVSGGFITTTRIAVLA